MSEMGWGTQDLGGPTAAVTCGKERQAIVVDPPDESPSSFQLRIIQL